MNDWTASKTRLLYLKFTGRHYYGFDEVCRKGLNVCDCKEGIQLNNDDYFRFHNRHSSRSQRYLFKKTSGC